MMKVTVTRFLNVRAGKPSLNAPCYQYLAPGSEIEVDGTLYKGDPYEGTDTWMRDKAGNYYWSGGVEQQTLNSQLLAGLQGKWWLADYGMPKIREKGFNGKGVKIALLDTGIVLPHHALDLDPALFTDVTKSPSGIRDLSGHGTHCAGILKASGQEHGPIGIAPGSTLYVCKVTHDTMGDKPGYLAQGIRWAITQNVDIISISKGDPFGDKTLATAVEEAAAKGILVVASSGNKVPGFPSDHIYYPARYPAVLSVGGIDQGRVPLQDSILTGETALFAPGKEILSTWKNDGFLAQSGSSQATPWVAGAGALLLEMKRRTDPGYSPSGIRDVLLNNASAAGFGKIVRLENLFG